VIVTEDPTDTPMTIAHADKPERESVSTPLADTVAIAVLLLDQVTVRPCSRAPLRLRSVAISTMDSPTETDVPPGLSAIDATGAPPCAGSTTAAALSAANSMIERSPHSNRDIGQGIVRT
jgi:hypothetical protein